MMSKTIWGTGERLGVASGAPDEPAHAPTLIAPTLPSFSPAPAAREGDIFQRGEVLSETFEIRGLLGQGGMGQVYEAQDLVLNRKVAIKVPWPHVPSSVRTEARALAALRHPSMVGIYGVWKHEGLEYVVMERIHGASLDVELGERQRAGRAFGIDELLDILAGIAEGLAEVHRAGMAHRDIKPANVMLAPDNRIVLMDFGIFQPEIDVTKTASIRGSPRYMAPEAVANTIAPGEAHLVDMYALGIVAFELLTGRVPFDGDDAMKVALDHVNAPVPDVTSLRADAPPRLVALMDQLLAKDPKDRPESMDSVARQLRRKLRVSALPPPRLAVVIAEDNPTSAEIIQALVAQAAPDAEVRVATDGQLALEMVKKKPPHLLLVDLQLPEVSGVELCMYLRATSEADLCTVVSVSAHANAGDLKLLRRMGISRFIAKGEELTEQIPALVEEVKRAVAAHAASRGMGRGWA